MAMFFWLLVGHALADYPLQGDFLARAKNHRNPVVAANGQAFPWGIALTAHALIHGGFVAFVTGYLLLGVCEVVVHMVIDYMTSAGKLDYVQDQYFHVVCKILWVFVALAANSV